MKRIINNSVTSAKGSGVQTEYGYHTRNNEIYGSTDTDDIGKELLYILDELSDMGYDIHDESDIKMGLGAGLGYDEQDQEFIMNNLRKRNIVSSETSDEYAEDGCTILSNVHNIEYWYFTKHGIQPGSIPKYVNVLDIIDKPEGSYFLTDSIINTKDLDEYEIREAAPENVDSCSEIEASYNVAIDKLHNELYNKIVKYGLSEGFPENEIDDYFFVTVLKAYDHIECEVRAEVDYEGLEALCDLLNPVVIKYNPDAYFEPVTSGIIEAYIYPTGKNKVLFAAKGSSDTEFMQLKRAYKNMRKFDDINSQSSAILDLEDELNSHNTPYERYEHKTDNGCTIFYDDYVKGSAFNNCDLTEYTTIRYKGKRSIELPGEHNISKLGVTGSTKLKRIARYGEFDNGNVLHDWKEMTDSEAEDLAKQMSLENPNDVYYVAYDDIMDSSSDTRWLNGQPYSFADVGIRGGKPYIKNKDIQSSHYGGAYDIDPKQYFTRNDIVEFADEVVDELNSKYNDIFDVVDLGMDDSTHLYIEVESEIAWASYIVKIDMRKIKKPSDLTKYVDVAVYGLSYSLDTVYGG